MNVADIDSWDVLSAADRTALAELNRTATTLPGQAVAAAVARIAEQSPDSVAVQVAGSELSYGQLLAASRKVAAGLRALGIGPGDVVAVLAAKEAELYPFLLAAFSASVVVAALDPQAPPGRMARCVEISSARLLICAGVAMPGLPGVAAVAVSELSEVAPDSPAEPARSGELAEAAYVTFTSGSTGVPKPVLIGQLGLANLVRSYVDVVGIGAGHRITQSAPLHYDASWQQIFAAWTTGATLLPVPDEVRTDGQAMASWLLDNGLSHWDSVPSMWYPVLDAIAEDARFSCLRRLNVVLAGEPLRRDAVAAWLAGDPAAGPLFNIYGPSEASIDATVYAVSAAEVANLPAVVPIGRPLANVRCYVLNENLSQCPIGVVGELYLGGAGLAAGYLASPAVTAERFLPDPFADEPGARMYATGDLVRLTSAGTLEFGGRRDEMIKLRGVRIDLTEVSHALAAIPGVDRAAVVLDRDREQLVAFLGESAPPDGAIYQALAETLPPSYFPARLVRVAELPLTSTGKVDRTLLQRIAQAQPAPITGPEPAAGELNPVQRALAEIWEQVLGTGPVGLDDNFFALGGDSINSIVVRDRAAGYGLAFEILDLFRGPTVRQLAGAVGTARVKSALPAKGRDRYPLLPGQTALYWSAVASESQRELCVQEIYWLAGRADPDDLAAAMDLLVDRHPALRVSFGDEAGVPWQQVASRPEVRVHRTEGDLDTVHRQAQAALDAIDPRQWPLFDLRVVELPNGRGALIWTMHHVITDGWSHAILRQELFASYRGIRTGTLLSADQPADDRYLEVLAAVAASTPMPLAEPGEQRPSPAAAPTRLPPTEQGGPGQERVSLSLTAERTTALSMLARRLGVTFNAVVLGAVAVALGRFADVDPVTVLCVSSGRSKVPDPESAVGCFISTLPVRVDLSGASPAQVPGRAEQALLRAMEREAMTAAELCQEAGVSSLRDFSDVLFLFQSYPEHASTEDLDALAIDDYQGYESIQFPLTIVCHQVDDSLIFDLDHKTSEIDSGLVDAFAAQLDAILAAEMAE